jgi:hypothetical protein
VKRDGRFILTAKREPVKSLGRRGETMKNTGILLLGCVVIFYIFNEVPNYLETPKQIVAGGFFLGWICCWWIMYFCKLQEKARAREEQ